jgi:GGDEF domain-containing protein
MTGDALLGRVEELARRWVIDLIRSRPLDGIGAVPLDVLALEAPSLCAQVLRAVQSDVELARLTGVGAATGREDTAPARRIAAITGAQNVAALVDAVESLRGVLWEALLDHLSEPSTRQVGDVADRLAYVCAAALAVAVDAPRAPEAAAVNDPEAVIADSSQSVLPASRAIAPGARAVIVDERPLSWDESPPVPPQARRAEIEIRDERREEGPAAWIGLIGGQLDRFERDRLPFAVLLVELVEITRVHRGESPDELAELAERLERELGATLKARSSSGSLTRERPGRYWLLAAGTDRGGAHELAEHIMLAVASCTDERASALEVAIGIAVCPEDGREAAALAAHADVGLYSDRSAVRASAGHPVPADESA